MDAVIEILLELILEGALEAANSSKVPMPVRVLLGGLVLSVMLAIIGLIAWVGICNDSVFLVILAVALLIGMSVFVTRKIRKFKKEQKKENWL